MAVSAKRLKAAKVARKVKKKKIPRKMKKKRPAKTKPEQHPIEAEEAPPEDVVVVVEDEPKTRLDLIRSRHSFMKQEIDQIRVALEEDPDE